ncbi:SDR family NAD(P)-dependent oxidoreductase [Sphingomonas lacunae]|uniref:SDR family NAD(P)-dependent oxidoreductase n=1 Tax=Sphingomonas lacunae TaxID=2698828 RepID=A0A6M4AW96_9SPHN|nr:SDR family NAD(P)-dependent oxidoreductase [Sphingomonas lacunae]QJQ32309.1 SDR family NAD(P)-dependent oxidoreductase [Sphingomonas lacunae]
MDLNGRIAWVTGASSGIGKALAVALAAEGASLILSGRRADALEDTANAVRDAGGGESLILPFDTTDLAALPAVVAKAAGWRGGIDVLVNNAGISQRSLAVDTETGVYDKVIATDLMAPIHLTQHCLPHLTAQREGGAGAMVVAISSVAGRAGVPLRTAYCAAKHGIIGYMDALRAEAEIAHGLRVLNVLPGSIATDVARNALTAGGDKQGHSDPQIDNGIPAEECAAAIVAAMKADQRELIFAQGVEAEIARLRHDDPETLFGMTAKLGARIAGVEG